MKLRLISIPLFLSCGIALQAQAVTLPEAVFKALQNHPDVRQGQARVEEGEWQTEGAKGGYLPTVEVTGDWGFEVVDNNSTRSRGEEHDTWRRNQVGFEVRQMLFDGFSTENNVDRTHSFTQARRHELDATLENLALSVSQAYLEVQKQRQLLELAEQILSNHQTIYEQIKSRVDRGVGTSSDLSQIESRLNNAHANVLSAQNNLIDAETLYQRQVGELAPQKMEEFGISSTVLPATMEQGLQIMLENNPTLAAARSDIEETRFQLKGSKASNYPEFDLVLKGNYGDNLSGIRGLNNDYRAVVEMRWNLFNGGRDKASTRQAAKQLDQAFAISDDATRQAEQGLRLAWVAYDVLGRQRNFLSGYKKTTIATRNAYRKEFNLGKRTLLDMLDSENEVFTAGQSYIQADYDYEASKVRILNAMGQLNETLGVR
ncbi:TolC family outer membrane protein [Ferrimonas sp.]|uniref:TolC family outer membrane protein n=1 Tax=Ferrimonas sp. TaxID=2080861 RepID=UPI003A8E0289